MKISTVAMLLLLCLASASALNAQNTGITVFVSAFTDIYQSGGYNDNAGGGAILPLAYVFPAGPGQVLTFLAVTGEWTCNAGTNQPYTADGTTSPVGSCYPRA